MGFPFSWWTVSSAEWCAVGSADWCAVSSADNEVFTKNPTCLYYFFCRTIKEIACRYMQVRTVQNVLTA